MAPWIANAWGTAFGGTSWADEVEETYGEFVLFVCLITMYTCRRCSIYELTRALSQSLVRDVPAGSWSLSSNPLPFPTLIRE